MSTWKLVAFGLGIFISMVLIRWEKDVQRDKAEAFRQRAIQRMQQDPRQAAEVDREATDFLGDNIHR